MNFEEIQQKQLSQMSHTERAQHEAIVKQLKASHAADPDHRGYLRDRWIKELEVLDPKPVEAKPEPPKTARRVVVRRQFYYTNHQGGRSEARIGELLDPESFHTPASFDYWLQRGDVGWCDEATQYVVLVDELEYQRSGSMGNVVATFGSVVELGEVMFAETIEEHVAAGCIAPISECYKVLKKFFYYKAEGGAASEHIAKPGQYLHPSKWSALGQPTLDGIVEAGWIKKC